MANTAATDFFGLSNLGVDPYLDAELQALAKKKTLGPDVNQPPAVATRTATAAPVFGDMNIFAQMMSQLGTGGLHQPRTQTAPGRSVQTPYGGVTTNSGAIAPMGSPAGGWAPPIAAPSGFNPMKWNDQNHKTPKYNIVRDILYGGGYAQTPDGLASALGAIKGLDPDADIFGSNRDKLFLPNLLKDDPYGDFIDVGLGFGAGGNQGWGWQPMNALRPEMAFSNAQTIGGRPPNPRDDRDDGNQGTCPPGYYSYTGPGGVVRCLPVPANPGETPGQPPRDDGGGPGNPESPGATSTPGSSMLLGAGNIPKDIVKLRHYLAQFLEGNFNKMSPVYGGNLNVGSSPYEGMAAGTGDMQMGLLMQAMPALQSMLGFSGTSNLSPMDPSFGRVMHGGPNNQGEGFLRAAASPFSDLMSNGGAPPIMQALNDIRSRGMMDIEDANANTLEQFSAQGLGRGTDVAEAIARGTSRGVAQINQDQSSLATSVLGDAANRRVSAVGMAPGMSEAARAPYEAETSRILQALPMLMERLVNPTREARENAMIRGQGISAIPGLGSTASAGGDMYSRLATMDLARREGNIGRTYQDFIRSTTPQYFDSALGFATGFPAPVNKPTVQSGGGGMEILMGLLPLLLA
jgi:hypothetical protein